MKRPLWRWVAFCALGAGISVAGPAGTAGAGPELRFLGGRPDFTWQQLPAGRFRDQLGALPQESRRRADARLRKFRFPPEDLGSLHVDPGGGIFYVDTFPLPAGAASSGPADAPVVNAAVPVSPFPPHLLFHSKPGALNTLYLDFDGENVTGTGWNPSVGRDPIPAVAFSTDGDITTFSDAEQADIKSMWQRVAEDYAPFDIDVTTERPSVFDNRTCHALITSGYDANGQNNPSNEGGGVAYVGVHGSQDYAYYRPAWIYEEGNALAESYIAETISHETGHNMGLSHDGTTAGVEYYNGHGSGEWSWAPIMGVGWAKNVSQWSRGEYYLANNTEDDLAIIASACQWRADDHADTLAGATALEINPGGSITSTTPETDPTNSSPANKGIIHSDGDVDLFTFLAGTGQLQISVYPWINPSSYRGGNLDVTFDLLDASGTVLATVDPPTTTTATLTMQVAGGRYYLRISGTGMGNPYSGSPTGYTGYASLGQYFVTGQVVEALFWMSNEGGATNVSHDIATLQGRLTDTAQQGATPVVGVHWGTVNAGDGTWQHNAPVGPRGVGPLSQTVSGLTPNTRYYYRFYGTHGGLGGWAVPSAELVAAGTVPFSETFDTLAPGDVHAQHGWEVDGTDPRFFRAASVQGGETHAGSAQACSVNSLELSHAFSGDSAGANVLWADMYLVPEPVDGPDLVPTNTDGRVLFFVDGETGALAALDGGTVVLFTNQPAVPQGEWVRFTTRIDYGNRTWDLWMNSDNVAYDLAFHLTSSGYVSTEHIHLLTGQWLIDQAGLSLPAGITADDVTVAWHDGSSYQLATVGGDPAAAVVDGGAGKWIDVRLSQTAAVGSQPVFTLNGTVLDPVPLSSDAPSIGGLAFRHNGAVGGQSYVGAEAAQPSPSAQSVTITSSGGGGAVVFQDAFANDTVGQLPTVSGSDVGAGYTKTDNGVPGLTDVEDDPAGELGKALNLANDGVANGSISLDFPVQPPGSVLEARFRAKVTVAGGSGSLGVGFTSGICGGGFPPCPDDPTDYVTLWGMYNILVTGAYLSSPPPGIAADDVALAYYNGSAYNVLGVGGDPAAGRVVGGAGQWIDVVLTQTSVNGASPVFTINGTVLDPIPHGIPAASPTVDGLRFRHNGPPGQSYVAPAAPVAPTSALTITSSAHGIVFEESFADDILGALPTVGAGDAGSGYTKLDGGGVGVTDIENDATATGALNESSPGNYLNLADDGGTVGILRLDFPSESGSVVEARFRANVTDAGSGGSLGVGFTSGTRVSRLKICDGTSAQPSYVDNVNISLERPAHILLLDSDGDGIDDDWERKHFNSLEVSDGGAEDDWDGDRFPDLFEFLANTDPTDGNSLLVISDILPGAADGLVLEWQSASNRTYAIEESSDLVVGDWTELIGDLPAVPPLNCYTLTVDGAGAFYRVTVGD